ncbi:MAG: LamG-like jellyroll fold domain-containing protein, partial [Candidatus Micrarchaeia archaeon]
DGVDAYNNFVIYQSPASISVLTPSGTLVWEKQLPFGSAPWIYYPVVGGNPDRAYPIVGNNTIYTVWAGTIAAQNLETGRLVWDYRLSSPYSLFSPGIALAYGKLFAIYNNNLIAFGTCAQGASSGSLLHVIASMYINNETGCAEALASSVYPMYNYTILISGGGINTSDISDATYYGHNYMNISNPALDTVSYTWSFWMYPYSWNPKNGIMGQQNEGAGYPYIYQSSNTTSSQLLVFTNDMNYSNSTIATPVSLNQWYHVVAEYSNVNDELLLFVNGNLVGSIKQNAPIQRGISAFYVGYLPIGISTFNGLISNLQIYSTALNQSQVGILYREGPTGSPLVNGIVAWYPTGCGNDYYSLNNTGQIPVSCRSLLRQVPLPPTYYNSHVISKASVPISVYNWYTHSSQIYNVSVISWQ